MGGRPDVRVVPPKDAAPALGLPDDAALAYPDGPFGHLSALLRSYRGRVWGVSYHAGNGLCAWSQSCIAFPFLGSALS